MPLQSAPMRLHRHHPTAPPVDGERAVAVHRQAPCRSRHIYHSHRYAIDHPSARVFFMEFRESSLEFELKGWIEDVDA
jgi:hypothetical protein